MMVSFSLIIQVLWQIVYGATGSVGSAADDTRVMSDKVQVLASSIYKEFETMIEKNGEDIVKVMLFFSETFIFFSPNDGSIFGKKVILVL